MMDLKIRQTADNSNTLFVPSLDEHYHSINGAVQESMHVFIDNGLKRIRKVPTRIFEMGFGTGLNALLTLDQSLQENRTIIYHAIDLHPLPPELVNQLEYETFLTPESQTYHAEIQTCEWDKPQDIDQDFQLMKIEADIRNYRPADLYDLVFWDAFGPDKQPELWTTELFKKIFLSTAVDGILVTYSAKGQVGRNLEKAGFKVTRIPGPPGKREMIRACKRDL
jgi:tRNA U34 5-methylaminomethyl-2-thiouridine-forming methyltransferase MnmC